MQAGLNAMGGELTKSSTALDNAEHAAEANVAQQEDELTSAATAALTEAKSKVFGQVRRSEQSAKHVGTLRGVFLVF